MTLIHAYGDEYVYRCGIEALYHQHHLFIQQNFDDDVAVEIIRKIDEAVFKSFINEEVINQFINESKKEARRAL